MGVLFWWPGFLPKEPEQLVPALKSLHEDGAPPAIDLILCLGRPVRSQPDSWIKSAWNIERNWTRTLVAENGQLMSAANLEAQP